MNHEIFLTLPTTRLDESIQFFRIILDFNLDRSLARPGGVTLAFLSRSGFTIELVSGPHIVAGDMGPGAPLITLVVSDFSDIMTRLDEARIPFPRPTQLPGGISMLRFPEPNGMTISLVSGPI